MSHNILPQILCCGSVTNTTYYLQILLRFTNEPHHCFFLFCWSTTQSLPIHYFHSWKNPDCTIPFRQIWQWLFTPSKASNTFSFKQQLPFLSITNCSFPYGKLHTCKCYGFLPMYEQIAYSPCNFIFRGLCIKVLLWFTASMHQSSVPPFS